MPNLSLPQGSLHYREAGTGEPVVFLHGYLMASDLWSPILERLRPDFHCIALDLPLGAHRTALREDADLSIPGLARLVADALDELNLENVTLVGNDSGGGLAQVVAAEHPERLGRLVLTPCDAFDNVPPTLFKPLVPAAKAHALTPIFQSLRVRAARNLPNAYGWLMHGDLPHDMIDGWVDAYFADKGVRRDVRKVTVGLEPSALLDAATKLASFDKPALVAFAADDKLFPFEHAERLGEILPNARVEKIANSRTWVMLDQPDITADLIRDFIRSTPVGATADDVIPA